MIWMPRSLANKVYRRPSKELLLEKSILMVAPIWVLAQLARL